MFNVHFSQAIQKYGWNNIKHEAHKGIGLGIPKSEKAKQHMKESSYMKNRPRFRITLQDGTVKIMTKANLTKNYLNKGIKVTIECI